jgi:lactate dehydrogenase-like 2-hydroxyacid dehydrogenase
MPPDIRLDPDWSVDKAVSGTADGLCCESVADLEALNNFSGIRVVSFTGTGISDVLEMPIVQGRGLTFCNIRDYASADVAEHAFALILGVAKRMIEADRLIHAGQWSTGGPWGMKLGGKTLGLVGLGSIGLEVARIAKSFGMEVVYWSRSRHVEAEDLLGIRQLSLDKVFSESDIVSLHLALTVETKGMVGAGLLERMKPGSFLVNTARGALVDGRALLDVLRSGRLGGAGLDVFDEEPLPIGHELLQLPNVLLTPHVGAATVEALIRARKECLQNVVSFFAGQPRNVVLPGD